jgi:pimeloyl-ACP methyl ester carboxylesterase
LAKVKQHPVLLLLPAALLALACAMLVPPSSPTEPPSPEATGTGPASSRPETATLLEQLGGYPCPDSDFTCIALQAPMNHFEPSAGDPLEVVFGVLPASRERKGMFVTAVGGPGGSGLAVADSYTAAFPEGIAEHFDVVFFDQRGVAASGGLQCLEAAADFYQTEADPTTPEGEQAMTAAAQAFARECVAETGRADLLPYLGTEQAIQDLELFRQAMRDDRFWLYGESYGTQLAQTYAAAFPERLAGLILDGPVDLTLDAFEYYAESAQAFNNTLEMILQACTQSEPCRTDMGGDPLMAYDALADRLAEEAATFEFPLPSGEVSRRSLDLGDLETAAASYVYSEIPRMILLRALAQAHTREDWVPLARIAYDSLGLDPATLEPRLDPTWSDAVYFAVECNDYDFGPAQDYLEAGDSIEAAVPRLGSVFYGDLPCAFWPDDGYDPGRPKPLRAEGIPTLVLVGTADPATPLANAERIVDRLADGHLVVEAGGPHVIFGWGNTCVDDLVADFLVDDVLPGGETTCEGEVIYDYVPVLPRSAADFPGPLSAMSAVDWEIYLLPEYYYWDLETPSGVGCAQGGTLEFEPSPAGESFVFRACAFVDGFVLDGTGDYDYDTGLLRLEVSVSGLQSGDLVYTNDGEGTLHLTGEYAGEAVDLSE